MKDLTNLPDPNNQQEVNTWLIANMSQMKERIKAIEEKIEPTYVREHIWNTLHSNDVDKFLEKKMENWWRKKVLGLIGKIIPITAIIQALISYTLMKFL